MTMSEKDLAKALLALGATELSNPPGSHEQTQKVLARDRRRVRLVGSLALCLWLVAAFILYWFMSELLALYPLVQHGGSEVIAPVYRFLLVLAGCLEAMIFAFLCTLILMFVSRRATLRQINANLIEISQQLKRLGRPQGE
jgi:hypothetical protein